METPSGFASATNAARPKSFEGGGSPSPRVVRDAVPVELADVVPLTALPSAETSEVLETHCRLTKLPRPVGRQREMALAIIAGALARGWTVSDLAEASSGCADSEYNVGRRREAAWVFATDQRIEPLIALARKLAKAVADLAAEREAAAARLAKKGADADGAVTVQIVRQKAAIAVHLAEAIAAATARFDRTREAWLAAFGSPREPELLRDHQDADAELADLRAKAKDS